MKVKNHLIIWIEVEKAFGEIQYPFMLYKSVNKLCIEGKQLNTSKIVCDNPMVKIILNGEKFEAFPLSSRITPRCPLSSLLFSIVLVTLAIAISTKKEIKDTDTGKEEVKSICSDKKRLHIFGTTRLHQETIRTYK